MKCRTFQAIRLLFHSILGVGFLALVGSPTFGAMIEVYSYDAQGDLQISERVLANITQFPVRPNPERFRDGRPHVILGAPHLSLSFDGTTFGPVIASLTELDAGPSRSTIALPQLTPPTSDHQASPVAVQQLPFEPFDIPNTAAGGVGGTLGPAFQFPPLESTDSIGFITVTIEGTVELEELEDSGMPGDISPSSNLVPNPVPGGFWLYVTGITVFGLLQRARRRTRGI